MRVTSTLPTVLAAPLLVATSLSCFACGPDVTGPGGAGGAGGDSGDHLEGGWTACQSPGGYRICGGPADCPTEDCGCTNVSLDPNDAGLCAVSNEWSSQQTDCPDGGLFYGEVICIPWEQGKLLCEADPTDMVRYLDLAVFDCEPLPEPDECPPTSELRLCGDACGSCQENEFCRGRSRLHPYGMCLPAGRDRCDTPDSKCSSEGESCFVYTVDESSQEIANSNGICIPDALCQAAAAELPGGGTCHPATPI